MLFKLNALRFLSIYEVSLKHFTAEIKYYNENKMILSSTELSVLQMSAYHDIIFLECQFKVSKTEIKTKVTRKSSNLGAWNLHTKNRSKS